MSTKPRDWSAICRYTTECSPLPMVAAEGPMHLVRYANPAFCRLVGKEREELLGRPFAEAVPEAEENGCLALLNRVYCTGKAENLAEQAHTHKTPGPVYWSYAVWAVLDEEEYPTGVIIQVTDTTKTALFRQQVVAMNQALILSDVQQHELREEAEGLNLRLQRAMQETNHRVKNNLQVVSALAEAHIEGDSPPVLVTALERIIAHTHTLASMHDLLAQEAQANAEYNLLSTAVSLNRLLPLLQDSSGRRRIHSEIAPMTLPLHKSAALSLLVSELVSNAVKHGEGEIPVTLEREGDKARLTVRDAGKGFPPGFDPRKDAHIGWNLILSLACHDLQGSIDFTTPSEGGACIAVTFPVPKEGDFRADFSRTEHPA